MTLLRDCQVMKSRPDADTTFQGPHLAQLSGYWHSVLISHMGPEAPGPGLEFMEAAGNGSLLILRCFLFLAL